VEDIVSLQLIRNIYEKNASEITLEQAKEILITLENRFVSILKEGRTLKDVFKILPKNQSDELEKLAISIQNDQVFLDNIKIFLDKRIPLTFTKEHLKIFPYLISLILMGIINAKKHSIVSQDNFVENRVVEIGCNMN
jgi:hypothetical protein